MTELQRVNPVQHFVRATKEHVGRRLGSHGFELEPIEEELDEVRAVYWLRRGEWKCDAVRLFYARTAPGEFNVDLGVYLPVEGRKGTIGDSPVGTLLHSADLRSVAGRKKPYHFPHFFGRPSTSRAASLAESIAGDLERSLGWFDQYEDPEECLRKLRAGETHWGDARGDAFRVLSDHLERAIIGDDLDRGRGDR